MKVENKEPETTPTQAPQPSPAPEFKPSDKTTLSASVKTGSNRVTFTRKKVKGAAGYQIYRSDSLKGTYKRIKTVTGNTSVKYTNKKLARCPGGKPLSGHFLCH